MLSNFIHQYFIIFYSTIKHLSVDGNSSLHEPLNKDVKIEKLESKRPERRKTHENLESSISKCFEEEISSKKTSINIENEYTSFEDKTMVNNPSLNVIGMGGSQIINPNALNSDANLNTNSTNP